MENLLETTDPTLQKLSSGSHLDLAKMSLVTLRRPENGSPRRIGQLLHRSLGEKGSPDGEIAEPGTSFEYAAKNWTFHLTAVPDPPDEILRAADDFIHELNFAFWVEYLLYPLDDLAQITTVKAKLKEWLALLPQKKREIIRIEKYFISAYRSLANKYKERHQDDEILPFLASMRLGAYYVDSGMTDNAIPLREQAFDGLKEKLGETNPLVLTAKRDVTLSYVYLGEFRKASESYQWILHAEKEVRGPDDPEIYRTMTALGATYLRMNEYVEAARIEQEASDALLRLTKSEDKLYLTAQLAYSYPLIELGKYEAARHVLESVKITRQRLFGPGDIFAASAQFSIGSIQRKQRDRESIVNLKESYVLRHKTNPLRSIWTMDFAIELLIAYWEFDHLDQARELLSDLDREAQVDQFYNRYCQVTHIRSFIIYKGGQRKEGIRAPVPDHPGRSPAVQSCTTLGYIGPGSITASARQRRRRDPSSG